MCDTAGKQWICSKQTRSTCSRQTEGAEVEILSAIDERNWAKFQRVALEYHEELRPGSKSGLIEMLRVNGFEIAYCTGDEELADEPIGLIRAERKVAPSVSYGDLIGDHLSPAYSLIWDWSARQFLYQRD